MESGSQPGHTLSRCRHLTAKYTLFVLNFFVTVGGFCLIAIGIVAVKKEPHLTSLDDMAVDPAVFLLWIGCVMVVLGMVGCMGPLREHIILLKLFSAFVVIIFLFLTAGGILTYFYLIKVKNGMTEYIVKSIGHYQDDNHLHDAVDYIQRRFSCCGATNYTDWDHNAYFNCSSPTQSSCGVPASCCKIRGNMWCGFKTRGYGEMFSCCGATNYTDWDHNAYFNCSSPTQSSCGVPASCCKIRGNMWCGFKTRGYGEMYAAHTINTSGCVPHLVKTFRNHLLIVGGIALSVGVLELGGLILAVFLMKNITLLLKQQENSYGSAEVVDGEETQLPLEILQNSVNTSKDLSEESCLNGMIDHSKKKRYTENNHHFYHTPPKYKLHNHDSNHKRDINHHDHRNRDYNHRDYKSNCDYNHHDYNHHDYNRHTHDYNHHDRHNHYNNCNHHDYHNDYNNHEQHNDYEHHNDYNDHVYHDYKHHDFHDHRHLHRKTDALLHNSYMPP